MQSLLERQLFAMEENAVFYIVIELPSLRQTALKDSIEVSMRTPEPTLSATRSPTCRKGSGSYAR